MNEYEGCDPDSCPVCDSEKTIVVDRRIYHEKSYLDQWCACNDCGYQWLEIIGVNIEIRFRAQDKDTTA